MDANLQFLLDRTGVSFPLAAQILRLLEQSGASQVEIITAMELVEKFRGFLKVSYVPDDHPANQ